MENVVAAVVVGVITLLLIGAIIVYVMKHSAKTGNEDVDSGGRYGSDGYYDDDLGDETDVDVRP